MEPEFRPLGRLSFAAHVVWALIALANLFLAVAAYAPYAVFTRSPGWRIVAPRAVRETGIGIEGLVGMFRDLSRAEWLLMPAYLLGTALLAAVLPGAPQPVGAQSAAATLRLALGDHWLAGSVSELRPAVPVRARAAAGQR